MIMLISGNSSTGKTYMAQRLLEKYHVPYLSIDHLKMGLYRADMNCGFTPMDSTEDIGEKLWPILKGIMMTNIENKQNLIIEGCYILPHHLEDNGVALQRADYCRFLRVLNLIHTAAFPFQHHSPSKRYRNTYVPRREYCR
ncbi:hypothetical protein [Paenibacillus solani]|uniref:hypothetical protein n=1 Tax=Paenibacillus solani TaxID=1705565 RepID=UPI003D2ACD35